MRECFAGIEPVVRKSIRVLGISGQQHGRVARPDATRVAAN